MEIYVVNKLLEYYWENYLILGLINKFNWINWVYMYMYCVSMAKSVNAQIMRGNNVQLGQIQIWPKGVRERLVLGCLCEREKRKEGLKGTLSRKL